MRVVSVKTILYITSASVAPLALMPAESPLRYKSRNTYERVVLLVNDLRCCLLCEDVDVC